jgi:hypothetical protein
MPIFFFSTIEQHHSPSIFLYIADDVSFAKGHMICHLLFDFLTTFDN